MDLIRSFWRKHRKKILVTTTCLGSGYLLYKLYNAHTRSLADLERELADERHNDEIIKTQMKAHFENIQMIADVTTLPHALRRLSSRIAEEIHVSSVMETLSKGKGTLVPSEKLHLWNELKILSFTRMVLSLWSVTMLSLYIRVQVNVLGRHLYIDTARGLTTSHLLEELDLIDREEEKKFLTSADYLATNGMPSLISDMKRAVKEVLKGKQLKDVLTTRSLEETVIRILDVFMSKGSPHHWVDYLMMAQDTTMSPRDTTTTSVPSSDDATVSKLHQLINETREVLTSTEFTNVAEISLKSCTLALGEEMEKQTGLAAGMQLAKLLPQIEKIVPEISAVPDENRFLQLIRDLPEVQLFFTLLYSNMHDKFLTYKRGSGTDIERSIYQSMTRDEFVARLICNRPLSFMSASDTTLLRTRVRPRGSDWFLVGMPSENESSIQMSSYLTYDEMAISALLGVSSPTTFINSGGRYNRGRKRSSGSFIRNGIVIGAVGCRFEQPGRMESQFIIVAMDDQPEGGELKSLWASLYDIHAFPSYNDVKTAVGAGSEDFAVLGPDSYFNVAAYKQRIALTIETVFADANDRATTAGKYAYVHVVGLGLGVWKVHASQPRWFVDAVADVLNRVRFPMIGIIDFSWFSLPSPATCGGAQHEDRLATPVGNSVQIRFSKRDPADPLSGIPPNSMLLVATYAWDGNAFPGNEIYTGSLCGSGDPATAACCTIYELHNPYINPYFGKVFTAPSSAT